MGGQHTRGRGVGRAGGSRQPQLALPALIGSDAAAGRLQRQMEPSPVPDPSAGEGAGHGTPGDTAGGDTTLAPPNPAGAHGVPAHGAMLGAELSPARAGASCGGLRPWPEWVLPPLPAPLPRPWSLVCPKEGQELTASCPAQFPPRPAPPGTLYLEPWPAPSLRPCSPSDPGIALLPAEILLSQPAMGLGGWAGGGVGGSLCHGHLIPGWRARGHPPPWAWPLAGGLVGADWFWGDGESFLFCPRVLVGGSVLCHLLGLAQGRCWPSAGHARLKPSWFWGPAAPFEPWPSCGRAGERVSLRASLLGSDRE